MSNYSPTAVATGASLADVVTAINTRDTSLKALINDGLIGGSTANNITSSTVERINLSISGRAGNYLGDVFSTTAQVRKGMVTTKSSGLVFSVATGRSYPILNGAGGATPQEIWMVRFTAAQTGSITANRRVGLDLGYDGVIDKIEVGNGATLPSVADGHIRIAILSSSASIHTVTLAGDTSYASANAWPKSHRADIQVIAGSSTASAARYLVVKAGTKLRSVQDSTNIEVTSDIIIDRNTIGAGGATAAYTASTAYFLHVLKDTTGGNTLSAVLHTSSSAPSVTGYNASGWIASRVTGASGHLYPVDTVGNENYLRRNRSLGTSDISGWDEWNVATTLKLKTGRVMSVLVSNSINETGAYTGGEFAPGGIANPVSGSSAYTTGRINGIATSSMPPIWVPTVNGNSFKSRKNGGAQTITVWLRGYKERVS